MVTLYFWWISVDYFSVRARLEIVGIDSDTVFQKHNTA